MASTLNHTSSLQYSASHAKRLAPLKIRAYMLASRCPQFKGLENRIEQEHSNAQNAAGIYMSHPINER